MRLILLTMALTLASPAFGGAWMRAEGTGFLSYSATVEQNSKIQNSLYVDYGARANLSLGIKINADMTTGRFRNGSGFVFARKPITADGRPFIIAYEVGIGTTFGQSSEPLLLTALGYGRGLKIGDHYGWLAVDGAVEWSLSEISYTAKLDTTFGLTLNERIKMMVQVFYSQTETESSTKFTPSLIWEPGNGEVSYQIGASIEDSAVALKFGLWKNF